MASSWLYAVLDAEGPGLRNMRTQGYDAGQKGASILGLYQLRR